ncbi:MAG: PEP-CTERM sorting domain-containing protein [Candidatus Acidiferrales bacterium]
MKRSTLAILALLAFAHCAQADTTDDFVVPTAIGGFSATFSLPSTVTVGGGADQVLTISDIPVSIDGTIVDFEMEFIPENGGTDSGNVLMHCDAGYIFCQLFASIGTTYPDGDFGPFYTLSNGQMTFLPGVYADVTITDPVPAPEPGTIPLLSAGLSMLLFFSLRRRSPGSPVNLGT